MGATTRTSHLDQLAGAFVRLFLENDETPAGLAREAQSEYLDEGGSLIFWGEWVGSHFGGLLTKRKLPGFQTAAELGCAADASPEMLDIAWDAFLAMAVAEGVSLEEW